MNTNLEPPKNKEQTSNNKIATTKELIAIGKDLFALFRDAALFVLAILLIAFPTTFNVVLVNAGFEEGSFMGLKWKKQLNNSNNDLKEARATITNYARINQELVNKLNKYEKKQPLDKNSVQELKDKSEKLNQATQNLDKTLSTTISTNDTFIDKSIQSQQWGVVYGGDTNVDSASYETTIIAKKYDLPNPTIYFRQGSYRSVSVVNNLEEAKSIEIKAKKRRSDAYIVNLSTWCPKTTQKDGYLQCQ